MKALVHVAIACFPVGCCLGVHGFKRSAVSPRRSAPAQRQPVSTLAFRPIDDVKTDWPSRIHVQGKYHLIEQCDQKSYVLAP